MVDREDGTAVRTMNQWGGLVVGVGFVVVASVQVVSDGWTVGAGMLMTGGVLILIGQASWLLVRTLRASREAPATTPAPALSLVQQRMQLDRVRGAGVQQCVGGSLLIVLFTAQLINSGSSGSARLLLFVWGVLGGVAIVGGGWAALRRARRDRTAFEAEHGRNAGVQTPIPRSPKRLR